MGINLLVPKGKTGIFGDNVTYLEASWLKKLWIPGQYDLSHSLHQDSAYVAQGSKLILTIHDLNFLERLDYSASKKHIN